MFGLYVQDLVFYFYLCNFFQIPSLQNQKILVPTVNFYYSNDVHVTTVTWHIYLIWHPFHIKLRLELFSYFQPSNFTTPSLSLYLTFQFQHIICIKLNTIILIKIEIFTFITTLKLKYITTWTQMYYITISFSCNRFFMIPTPVLSTNLNVTEANQQQLHKHLCFKNRRLFARQRLFEVKLCID